MIPCCLALELCNGVSEKCKSCTENRIRFKEDKKDCDVLFDVMDELRSKLSHQEGDQGQYTNILVFIDIRYVQHLS